MRYHLFFEQSGTFKNEFLKLGFEAYDYDIQNQFGETDFVVDLFFEIEAAFLGKKSLFDKFNNDDFIFAFFPCTRFESVIPLGFRGELYQQKNWDDIKKLEYSMKLHDELSSLYSLISKLAIVCLRLGLKLIIENPYTQPHYLTSYWCLKPSLIDYDRTLNGDFFKKPTQYWFINFSPKNNLVFESLDYVEVKCVKFIKGCNDNKQTIRSLIHPQYANRFIRQYIID